ncbi:UvrB/UvrC motif-containing protein, partial [candidate division WWE3 bacterium]|nr:UvrB/UvrC motif-containing protein [candidate division WWE3 bacterium]
VEALLLEATVIQALRPKYNTALKDDKRYKYIEISDTNVTYLKKKNLNKIKSITHPSDAYPYVTTARKANVATSAYFGPFPKGNTVNDVVRLLRKSFGWCAYKTKAEADSANKPCFYYQLKQCPGYCAGVLSYEQYLEHMQRIVRFLSGEKEEVIEQLQKLMVSASENTNYEQASLYRDQIKNLEYVLQQFRQAESFITNPVLEEEQFYFARKQLREMLGEINPHWAAWLRNLERIEAYDISNTSGKEATGSMVVLLQGFPTNSQYRRFRIRDLSEPNDFAMMQQVLQRRLSRFKKQSSTDTSFSEIPQLLVIDGGKGQVSAVLDVLEELQLDIPTIGLAKREEQIIVPVLDTPGSYKTVDLPLNSPS